MNRRDFYRYGTVALGNLAALALAVPGVAYLLDPVRKRSKQGGFQRVAKLSELTLGAPKSVSIVAERQDAWVNYPREPVGAVWLVRQPPGTTPEVAAFSTVCPHMGCPVNLSDDRQFFHCPCHTSSFTFAGKPLNQVPPRGMDALEVELSNDPDPEVRVRYRRFRAQSKEKTPLV